MWSILNFIPAPGVKRRALPEMIGTLNASLPEAERLELFAPTFVQVSTEGGKVSRTERPLLYHYIFVKGAEASQKLLCRTFDGLSFVLDRAGEGRHLSVSDETLEQFRIIARFYGNQLPCYPLEGISLEEGDKVQIVSGPCAGLTGTFISRKGGKSGNILVAVDRSLAAMVYDIKADYVRVIEFAKDSRRVYDQLDAFTLKLLNTLQNGANALADTELVPAATVFARRLGGVRVNNPKLDAKLHILLFAAYSILGDKPAADAALEAFGRKEKNITNSATRALCLFLQAVFGDRSHAEEKLAEAREEVKTLQGRKPSKIQELLLKALS